MSDKRKRIIEHAKSAIIVLLLISAAALLYSTGYYSGAFQFIDSFIRDGGDITLNAENDSHGSESHRASRAVELSVSFSSGSRYSSVYDAERVDEDHSRFSAFLGEALGSASSPEAVNKAAWINALESESIYIRYYTPQSLNMLSAQLGTVLSASAGDAVASEFCLMCGDSTAYLLYHSEEGYYSCNTAVSSSALRSRIEEYVPNDSLFSHDDELLKGLRESTLILKNFSSVPEVTGEGGISVSQLSESLMSALGLNEYTSSQYSEGDGTAVYVDSNCVLRVSPSGHVRFELNGEATRTSPGSGLEAALELSWELANETIGKYSGVADIYLSDFIENEEGSYSVFFDYVIDGVPLKLRGKYAACYEIKNSQLISAELYCRSYSFSGNRVNILPMYQAAAIASAEGSSGITLVYSERQDTIDCFWVNE